MHSTRKHFLMLPMLPPSFLAVPASGLALSAMLVSCGGETASSPDESIGPLSLAQDALGGAQALADAELLTYDAEGSETVVDEGAMPGASRGAGAFTLRGQVDLQGDGLRLAYERTSTAIVPGMVSAFEEIVADGHGYVLGNELIFGAAPDYLGADMSPARVGAVRRQQYLLNPHMLLRGLSEADVVERDEEDVGGAPHRVVAVPDPADVYDIELLIDPVQGRISRVRTMEVDHLRGDVEVTADFEDWRDVGGLAVPHRLTLARDGVELYEETRSEAQVGPLPASDPFAMPALAGGLEDPELEAWGAMHSQFHHQFVRLGTAPFFDWPVLEVVANEVVPGSGTYHLVGGGHHSLLVDQGDHVVLVEAPLYEARSEAILGWIEDNLEGGLAGNPVTHVIATHHHADHSGGLRRFVAQGAVVVVGADAQGMFEDVFGAAWTLRPDELSSLTGASIEIQGVAAGESVQLGNVFAYAITSAHAADMLMVHVSGVGDAGVLFNSDLYLPDRVGIFPGSIFDVGGRELDAALVAEGLAEDTLLMVGGHGNIDSATGEWFTVDYRTFHQQVLALGS